jgi:hypothetical protein
VLLAKLLAVREFCRLARTGIIDGIAILSLLGVAVNLAWCMSHGRDIERIQKLLKAQEAQIQQQQKQQKPFVPPTVARKFQLF